MALRVLTGTATLQVKINDELKYKICIYHLAENLIFLDIRCFVHAGDFSGRLLTQRLQVETESLEASESLVLGRLQRTKARDDLRE